MKNPLSLDEAKDVIHHLNQTHQDHCFMPDGRFIDRAFAQDVINTTPHLDQDDLMCWFLLKKIATRI